MRIFSIAAALIFLLSATLPAADKPAGLVATLSTGKSGQIEVVFKNGTDREARIDKQIISTPILALDVLDAAGKVIPTIPPPIPAAVQEFVVVPPGKEITRSYELNVFSPPLPPGTYRVRLAVPEWKADELKHVIK
jgi:hypothetical protein